VISHKLNSMAARMLALTMAGWTAALVLWSPQSLASSVAGDGWVSHVINGGILALCALGWADILWRDIGGRLIWPSFPGPLRRRICVLTYSVLAGLTGVRAFVASGSDRSDVVLVGSYYIICAVAIGVVAVAIALEPRHAQD
jgi:hypothetical protein